MRKKLPLVTLSINKLHPLWVKCQCEMRPKSKIHFLDLLTFLKYFSEPQKERCSSCNHIQRLLWRNNFWKSEVWLWIHSKLENLNQQPLPPLPTTTHTHTTATTNFYFKSIWSFYNFLKFLPTSRSLFFFQLCCSNPPETSICPICCGPHPKTGAHLQLSIRSYYPSSVKLCQTFYFSVYLHGVGDRRSINVCK